MLEVFATEDGTISCKARARLVARLCHLWRLCGGGSALRAAILAGHDRPSFSAQINFSPPPLLTDLILRLRLCGSAKAPQWSRRGSFLASLNTGRQNSLHLRRSPPRQHRRQPTNGWETLEIWQRKTACTADTPMLKGIVPQFLDQFHFRPLINGVPFSGTKSQDHLIAFKPKFDFAGSVAEQLLLLCDINPLRC